MELLLSGIMMFLIVAVSIGVLLRWADNFENGKPIKGYDPHYTRKLEQQEFGKKFTKCEDRRCSECYPPIPPKGSAGIGVARQLERRGQIVFNGQTLCYECSTCRLKYVVPSLIPDDGYCQMCKVSKDKYKGYRQQDKDFQRWLRDYEIDPRSAVESKKKEIMRQAGVNVPPARPRSLDCGCIDFFSDDGFHKTIFCEPCKNKTIDNVLEELETPKPLVFRTPEMDWIKK